MSPVVVLIMELIPNVAILGKLTETMLPETNDFTLKLMQESSKSHCQISLDKFYLTQRGKKNQYDIVVDVEVMKSSFL